jgi:hypothetical protein
MGLEIGYAHSSFKWKNNASGGAGVVVAVVSFRAKSARQKHIFVDGIRMDAKNINGYLLDGEHVYMGRQMTPISALPPMTFGSKPTDGGWLILSPKEKEELLANAPEAIEFVKQYAGSEDYIKGIERYCLWIPDDRAAAAKAIPPVRLRIQQVEASRMASAAQSTVDFAAKPWRFKQRAHQETDAIIVPRVSSERRDYIPMGYLSKDTVISDAAFAVFGAEPWVFAVLVSRMHMAWTRAVAGYLGTSYRYSNTIVYNNFPFPRVSEAVKTQMTNHAFKVLDARAYHSERTPADLYDPDKMPENLWIAHQELDEFVDSVYRRSLFSNDQERLSMLFQMHTLMIEETEQT